MALPDFPETKAHARRLLLRYMQQQVVVHEPLLRGIRHNVVHEGATMRLTRADDSIHDVPFYAASGEIAIPREEMRRATMEQLLEKVNSMALQLAGQQVQLLLTRVGEAVDEVGNSVSAKELGMKEAFLEMQRRIEMNFDPDSLEPKDMALVMHPSQVESFRKAIEEWERDPEFVAEMERIRKLQIEAWHARQDDRKLVD